MAEPGTPAFIAQYNFELAIRAGKTYGGPGSPPVTGQQLYIASQTNTSEYTRLKSLEAAQAIYQGNPGAAPHAFGATYGNAKPSPSYAAPLPYNGTSKQAAAANALIKSYKNNGYTLSYADALRTVGSDADIDRAAAQNRPSISPEDAANAARLQAEANKAFGYAEYLVSQSIKAGKPITIEAALKTANTVLAPWFGPKATATAPAIKPYTPAQQMEADKAKAVAVIARDKAAADAKKLADSKATPDKKTGTEMLNALVAASLVSDAAKVKKESDRAARDLAAAIKKASSRKNNTTNIKATISAAKRLLAKLKK